MKSKSILPLLIIGVLLLLTFITFSATQQTSTGSNTRAAAPPCAATAGNQSVLCIYITDTNGNLLTDTVNFHSTGHSIGDCNAFNAWNFTVTGGYRFCSATSQIGNIDSSPTFLINDSLEIRNGTMILSDVQVLPILASTLTNCAAASNCGPLKIPATKVSLTFRYKPISGNTSGSGTNTGGGGLPSGSGISTGGSCLAKNALCGAFISGSTGTLGTCCNNEPCSSSFCGSCSATALCPAGETCQGGTCVSGGGTSGCTTSSQCSTGQICLSGSCTTIPTGSNCNTVGAACCHATTCQAVDVCPASSLYCAGGLACDPTSKKCAACTSSTQCPSGQTCSAGKCQPNVLNCNFEGAACCVAGTTKACAAGFTCGTDSKCHTTGGNTCNPACSANQTCVNGTCQNNNTSCGRTVGSACCPGNTCVGSNIACVNNICTACALKSRGDANCDGHVDLLHDFAEWSAEFTGVSSAKNADFNNDGTVDLLKDFAAWSNGFLDSTIPH